MNFDLTEEQQLVRETVREFARNRVAPVATSRTASRWKPRLKQFAEVWTNTILRPSGDQAGSLAVSDGHAMDVSRTCVAWVGSVPAAG